MVAEKTDGASSISARLSKNLGQDYDLVISAVVCVGMGCYVLLVAIWDVLPEWAPMPGGNVMFQQCCCLLCSSGVYYWASIAIVLFASWRVLRRLFEGRIRSVFPPALILFVVSFFALIPPLGAGTIRRTLVDYGIRRYDKVISAVEQYKTVNGIYPESLDVLVPDYLRSKPGILFKYGSRLNYAPDTWSGDVAPFRFELHGIDSSGVHGRILKYCPIELNCPDGDQINDKWMWTYSSAF
jgi:hypothetical protein